jgi:hypothetical protein
MMDSTLDIHKESSSGHLHRDLGPQILEAVRRAQEYDLEELLHAFPRYNWNQIFLEVDRLSRTGELRLLSRGSGLYTVRPPVHRAQQKPREQSLVNVQGDAYCSGLNPASPV